MDIETQAALDRLHSGRCLYPGDTELFRNWEKENGIYVPYKEEDVNTTSAKQTEQEGTIDYQSYFIHRISEILRDQMDYGFATGGYVRRVEDAEVISVETETRKEITDGC